MKNKCIIMYFISILVVYLYNKIKQIEIMKLSKSLLMSSAWNIFKMSEVTFSEALISAWEKIKSGVKAVIVKSNKLVKSAGLGYETVYFNELVFQNIVVSRESVDYNPAVEKYYGNGQFNND